MLAYFIRRVLATIPVVLMVALFVFSLLYIAPGDPAAIIAGDQASPEDVERIRASLGSGSPIPGALRRVAVAGDARRSRHLDLHQSVGHPHDQPAHRADRVADGADVDPVAERRHSDGRDRGLETWHADRPGRDDGGGVRLFDAGIRGWLSAGLSVRAAAGLAAGAGLHLDHARAWFRSCAISSCRRWRLG